MDRPSPQEIAEFAGVGSVIAGKYRVERVLGTGGMGVVVAARHLQLDETVAIKFLLPRSPLQKLPTARFLREARVASRMKTPHVARVFDVDVRSDGAPYIVMEYLEGETLAAELRRRERLPFSDAADRVLEVCEAVAEAHELGVIHRDLKPANLFLARGGGELVIVKVLDFGISKLEQPDASEPEPPTTGEGPLGSPPYMSPEQLTDAGRVDQRTDIWSLGVILYECVTGKSPFASDSFGKTCSLVLQHRPEPAERLVPELPRRFAQALERCLAKDRGARYPRVLELARDLAPHGTVRAQRALERIEAMTRAAKPAGIVVEREAPSTATPNQIDTGTLTAAANQPPTPSSAGTPRGRTLGVALAALVSVALGVGLWRARPALGPSVVLDGGAGKTELSAHAAGPPKPPLALPSSVAPAAAPVTSVPAARASARPRRERPAIAPSARGIPRPDPVFDDRR